MLELIIHLLALTNAALQTLFKKLLVKKSRKKKINLTGRDFAELYIKCTFTFIFLVVLTRFSTQAQ